MLLAGFEPAIPGSGRPQTHVLDRAATGSTVLKTEMSVLRYALINIIMGYIEV